MNVFQHSLVSACCFLFIICAKVHEAFEDAASKERREDSSDAELRCLQKTQQLRVGTPHICFIFRHVNPNNDVKL